MATGLSGGFVVAAPLPCRACVTGRHIAHTCSKAKPNTKTGGKKAASKKDAGPKLTVGLKIEHCFGVGTKDANWQPPLAMPLQPPNGVCRLPQPTAPPRPDPRCIGAAVPRVPDHQRREMGGA